MSQQKTKTTYIELRAITIEDIQQEVQSLLNWDADKYTLFIYTTGIAYLKEYFGKDNIMICWMERRKEFWNWFKNYWAIRDETFVRDMYAYKGFDRLENVYRDCHNAKILACEIAPNRIVYGNYICSRETLKA